MLFRNIVLVLKLKTKKFVCRANTKSVFGWITKRRKIVLIGTAIKPLCGNCTVVCWDTLNNGFLQIETKSENKEFMRSSDACINEPNSSFPIWLENAHRRARRRSAARRRGRPS